MKNEEIASLLDISLAAVKSRLCRARRMAYKKLSGIIEELQGNV
jgi:DNA-directed RNA polymerase specialized sigma24 family protein